MKKIYRKHFLILSTLMCVVGLFGSNVFAAEEWITDEVLKQLSEIRRDMKELRKDVREMRGEISTIQTVVLGQKKTPVKNVTFGDKPRLGKEKATVAIVEFSDFECPFCRRHNQQTMPKIKEKYTDTGKVQYVMRDFPLGFHKKAKAAAIAANCAGEQGAYWETHDYIFENTKSLKRELYVDYAKTQKLDEGKFIRCLDDPKQAKKVEQDMVYGASIGVSGTPAFFIGRFKDGKLTDVKMLSGARSFDSFKKIIDPLLLAKKQ